MLQKLSRLGSSKSLAPLDLLMFAPVLVPSLIAEKLSLGCALTNAGLLLILPSVLADVRQNALIAREETGGKCNLRL